MLWAISIVGSIVAAIGDAVLKKWADNPGEWKYLAFGCLVYLAEVFFFAGCMRYRSLSSAVSMFVTMNALFGVLIGIFWYGDRPSAMTAAGMLLALVAVVLMELGISEG